MMRRSILTDYATRAGFVGRSTADSGPLLTSGSTGCCIERRPVDQKSEGLNGINSGGQVLRSRLGGWPVDATARPPAPRQWRPRGAPAS